MSTLQVSNVQFDLAGSNKIYYDGANLQLTSANVNISGRLNANNVVAPAYYDSSNTYYYVTPSSNSVMSAVRVTQLGLNNITYMSKTGLNGFLIVINGKLYSCSGNAGTWGNYLSGRGTTGTTPVFGFNSMRTINFPGETGTLTKVGSGGDSYAFALFSTGNLYTWGYNSRGACGVGTTSVVATPTLAATGVTDAWDHYTQNDYSGDDARLFIKKTDNFIYAAGYNAYGQLGDGTTTSQSSFTKLTNLGTTVANVWPIGSTYGFTFFQHSNNMIQACGYNVYGVLGNSANTTPVSPVDVTTAWGGLAGSTRVIKKIVGGSGYHNGSGPISSSTAVMLLDDGTTTYLRAAGYNAWGSVGSNGVSATATSVPVTPPVGTGRISTISGGGGASTIMVLKENGDLYNWGHNAYGQLGNGTTTDNGTPTLRTTSVTGIYSDWTEHVQGYINANFYTKSTGLYASGYNGYGQLGVGDTTNRTSFTRVLLPADFTVADIGGYSTSYPCASYLAVGTDGRMYVWGHNGNYGVTPDTTTNCLAPIQITLPLGA